MTTLIRRATRIEAMFRRAQVLAMVRLSLDHDRLVRYDADAPGGPAFFWDVEGEAALLAA